MASNGWVSSRHPEWSSMYIGIGALILIILIVLVVT